MLSDEINALLDIVKCAMICMMSVLIFGVYYDAVFPKENHLQKVPCSVTIIDMAKKFHVTLMDECEIE